MPNLSKNNYYLYINYTISLAQSHLLFCHIAEKVNYNLNHPKNFYIRRTFRTCKLSTKRTKKMFYGKANPTLALTTPLSF